MSEQGNTDVLHPLPHHPSRAFDHGAVSRFNAWFFTAFARYINHVARHHKLTAFSGLQSGATVLEIGAGTGANLHHLPAGTRLYAVEPSLRMHERLRRRCAAAGVEVQILATGAEAIPLPNASVDEVICSLVLCTAQDPAQVLAEVRRVLRPGGRFRFVEHVASPHRGIRSLVQRRYGGRGDGSSKGATRTGTPPKRSLRPASARCTSNDANSDNSIFWPVNTAACGIAIR